jgi:hypothetical protein
VTLPVEDRLLVDPATLSLAELLLSKLQIVELNEKDQGGYLHPSPPPRACRDRRADGQRGARQRYVPKIGVCGALLRWTFSEVS